MSHSQLIHVMYENVPVGLLYMGLGSAIVNKDIYPCTPKAKENAYSKALKRRAGSVHVDINKYCRRLWPYLEYEKNRNETCLLNRGPAWKSPHIR